MSIFDKEVYETLILLVVTIGCLIVAFHPDLESYKWIGYCGLGAILIYKVKNSNWSDLF